MKTFKELFIEQLEKEAIKEMVDMIDNTDNYYVVDWLFPNSIVVYNGDGNETSFIFDDAGNLKSFY